METIKDATQQEAELEMLVSTVIRDVGIPMHILGYDYVKEAVILVIENKSYLQAVTKELYPLLARRHESTPSRVERGIRHAIEVAWNRGNMEAHDKLFGYTVNALKGQPTNSEFIAGIAEYIRMLVKTGRPWRE